MPTSRRAKPRYRPARNRCRSTPGRFWLHGYPAGRDDLYPRRTFVVYANGSISGDDQDLIDAAWAEANRRGADMSQPLAALSVLLSVFCIGVQLGGDVPGAATNLTCTAGAVN